MSKLKILSLALLALALCTAVAVAEAAPEAGAAEAAPLFAEAPVSAPVEDSCADGPVETQADLPAELQGNTVGSFEDTRVNAAGGCYFVSYDCQDCPNGQVKGCTTERCWVGGKWKYQTSCSSCGNFC